MADIIMTITQPDANQVFDTSDSVRIQVSISGDDTSQINKVSFYYQGQGDESASLIDSDSLPDPQCSWSAPSVKSDTEYTLSAQAFSYDGTAIGDVATCSVRVNKDPSVQNKTPYENGSQNLGYGSDGKDFGADWGKANFSITAQNKWGLTLGISQNITVGMKSYTTIGGTFNVNVAFGADFNLTGKLGVSAGCKSNFDSKVVDLRADSEEVAASKFEAKLNKTGVVLGLKTVMDSHVKALNKRVNITNQDIVSCQSKVRQHTTLISSHSNKFDQVNNRFSSVSSSIESVQSQLSDLNSDIQFVDSRVCQAKSEIKSNTARIESIEGVVIVG
ncbi:Ig-like domain-containing protein [Dongshaea marina]|uniref:Ig-like domain-containing protein n=1 Tax=Dongshaea marina TaxID=2047966 RepID=UPI000D3E7881|nr:Ig-like domain-containing protein [Dongshaea marina]